MQANIRRYLQRNAFLLLAIVVLGAVTGTGFAIIKLDRDYYLSNMRREVEKGLFSAAEKIGARFFETVLVAKNVESILQQSDGVVDSRIAQLVKEYQEYDDAILAVALAPGLEVTHSFPQVDYSKSIGLKYWQVPTQMTSVAQAYRTRDPVVAGPVSLAQGGEGYILRYPVFLPGVRPNVDRFWGVISIVVKADRLFSSGIQSFDAGREYFLSLTKLPSMASETEANSLSEGSSTQAVAIGFSMLGSRWQAQAIPKDGWPKYSPQSPYLLGFALLSKLLLILGLFAYHRLTKKKERAYALLSEAVDYIDDPHSPSNPLISLS